MIRTSIAAGDTPTSKVELSADNINLTGATTVTGGLTADSLKLGDNTVRAITTSMINSANNGADTLATAAAVYAAIGHVDGLVTADAQGVRTFNGTAAEGLTSTNTVNGHYYGNLATGTNVARDLVVLDNAVGNLNFKAIDATGEGEIATNYLNGRNTVSGALVALDGQAKTNADAISAIQDNYVTTNTEQDIVAEKTFKAAGSTITTAINNIGVVANAGGSEAGIEAKAGDKGSKVYVWNGEGYAEMNGSGLYLNNAHGGTAATLSATYGYGSLGFDQAAGGYASRLTSHSLNMFGNINNMNTLLATSADYASIVNEQGVYLAKDAALTNGGVNWDETATQTKLKAEGLKTTGYVKAAMLQLPSSDATAATYAETTAIDSTVVYNDNF